ncbi:hypothetical protein VUR80DRAFT_5617 [Thermomyces stellatus]
MAWRHYFGVALLFALASVYLGLDDSVKRLEKVIGRVRIEPAKLTHWENSTALNNGDCTVDEIANACEDVKIHFASSTAFIACGDPLERTKWYPPACRHNAQARSEDSFRESVFKHDIKTGTTTELQIEGLEGDFVSHGIDIYQPPNDPSKVHIFAVRHAREGDSVSIFSHTLGTNVMSLVKDVKHASIKTANGVAAVGEFEFYMTNDHYFLRGPMRYLEERLGPWRWATEVQYCDASQSSVYCRQVTERFPGANGIAVWEDRLFVGDSKNGTVSIYELRDDHGAEFKSQIELGAAADNINIIPTTGDLIVSIFPTLEDLPTYLANVHLLGRELLVPAAALRLPKMNGYKPELIYYDDGSVVSDMTAMALDPYSGVVIGAAVLQYGGFAVCKLPEDVVKSLA